MSDLDHRFSKIDDAIQRLANVSADLSKLLAVQEQRLVHQEKAQDNIITSLDKRRAEVDKKLEDVYEAVKKEIEHSRKTACMQHDEQNVKINRLERVMWMAAGGGVVLGWLLSYGMQAYRLFGAN